MASEAQRAVYAAFQRAQVRDRSLMATSATVIGLDDTGRIAATDPKGNRVDARRVGTGAIGRGQVVPVAISPTARWMPR